MIFYNNSVHLCLFPCPSPGIHELASRIPSYTKILHVHYLSSFSLHCLSWYSLYFCLYHFISRSSVKFSLSLLSFSCSSALTFCFLVLSLFLPVSLYLTLYLSNYLSLSPGPISLSHPSHSYLLPLSLNLFIFLI